MKERLDLLWEEFHLPIWATEFDWNWHEAADFGDHSYHAEVLDNFYRLMFSHQVGQVPLACFSLAIACQYVLTDLSRVSEES